MNTHRFYGNKHRGTVQLALPVEGDDSEDDLVDSDNDEPEFVTGTLLDSSSSEDDSETDIESDDNQGTHTYNWIPYNLCQLIGYTSEIG